MRVYGSPFQVDWCDLKAVVAYAKQLGEGQIVVKYDNRPNYNITHANRWYPKPGAQVVWREGGRNDYSKTLYRRSL